VVKIGLAYLSVQEEYIHCGENVKGKAIPIQGWTGPEDSRMLRLPDFKTLGT